jgi:hypothetical protein
MILRTEIIPLNIINGLVFLMQKQCVSCDAGTEYLSTIQKTSVLQIAVCLLMAIILLLIPASLRHFVFNFLTPYSISALNTVHS